MILGGCTSLVTLSHHHTSITFAPFGASERERKNSVDDDKLDFFLFLSHMFRFASRLLSAAAAAAACSELFSSLELAPFLVFYSRTGDLDF